MIYTAFILTLIICFLLILYHWNNNKSIILFVYVFFSIGQRSFIYLLLESGTAPGLLAYLYIHNIPFALLMAPALYYYTKSIILNHFYVDRWIWVFILPFLASIVSLQPYFQIPISEKIAFFRLANATDVDNDFFAHASRWIPIQFFQYSILIINSVFFFYCIFILIKARKSTSKIIKKRINNFLGILGTIALLTYLPSLIVYTFVYSNSNYFLNGVITVKSFPPLRYLSIFTLLTPILILFFPNWLYANQVNANQTSKWDLFLSKYLDKNCDIDKPETPQIDEDLTRIMTFLKDEQQYLNPLLSIHEISKSLDIPQARVTYFFNKVLKVPFPRLRNQLRIEHAIELMAQNAHLSLSIEGIAMQSGFKNKSTFYIAFKDEKGMTPIDWINKQIS